MIETVPRLIDEDAEGSIDVGHGGGDPGDDGPGDGWGWWDSGDEWPRQRRSRIRRTVALVTAAMVVAASIGTGVALLAGTGTSPFALSSIRTSIGPSTPGAADPYIEVHFVVTNTGARSERASCQATLLVEHGGTETATVTTSLVRAGMSAPVDLRVPVPLPVTRAQSVQVGCIGSAEPEQAQPTGALRVLPNAR